MYARYVYSEYTLTILYVRKHMLYTTRIYTNIVDGGIRKINSRLSFLACRSLSNSLNPSDLIAINKHYIAAKIPGTAYNEHDLG